MIARWIARVTGNNFNIRRAHDRIRSYDLNQERTLAAILRDPGTVPGKDQLAQICKIDRFIDRRQGRIIVSGDDLIHAALTD